MTNLTPILEAVIALAVAIITAFVLPWLRSKTTAEERKELLDWVDIAVAAAQQLYHQLDGKSRLDYALAVLQDKGYDVDDSAVVDAVEAAVLKLHQQLDGNKGAPGETQRSGFVGERTSGEVSELSPTGGSEGYGDCEDENDG